jgi:hypothetical protein
LNASAPKSGTGGQCRKLRRNIFTRVFFKTPHILARLIPLLLMAAFRGHCFQIAMSMTDRSGSAQLAAL